MAALAVAPDTGATVHGRLADCVQGERGGDGVRYIEGEAFDTITLGAETSLHERNSVILIPNLLSATECAELTADVERAHCDAMRALDGRGDSEGMERYMVPELSARTQQMFDAIMRQRLLPFVSSTLPPHIEDNIWAMSMVFDREERGPLAEQRLKFSAQEPAINRYSTHGAFEPHRDKLAMTLNVLLSDTAAFVGGGTRFWREEEGDEERGPTACLLPQMGCGVVFNGTVRHAGREVRSGLRHLLVASFNVAR